MGGRLTSTLQNHYNDGMDDMALDGTLHRMFCQKLRSFRKAKGITQQAMAERMGIAQSAYCQLETGRYEPRLSTVEKAAVALGVKAEELLSAERLEAVA